METQIIELLNQITGRMLAITPRERSPQNHPRNQVLKQSSNWNGVGIKQIKNLSE